MTRWPLFLVGAVVALLMLPSPRAGAQASGEIQVLDVDSSQLPAVSMVVAVPQSFDGEDLSSGSFAATENGAPVELDAARDPKPLDVVLVLDSSGSMQGEALAGAIGAARGFIDRLDPSTRVALVTFGDSPRTVLELTGDHALVSNELGRVTSNGQTSLYDAMRQGSLEFTNADARKVIVLLSDGKDTVSAAAASDAGAAIVSEDVELFSIALDSSDADHGALQSLTADVDGRWVPAGDVDSLDGAYAEVATRLDNRWVLAWTSARQGPVDLVVSVARDGRVATVATESTFGAVAAASGGADAATPGISSILATETPTRSWIDTWGAPLGIAAIAVAMLLMLLMVRNPGKPVRRIADGLGAGRDRLAQSGGIREAGTKASDAAERLLERANRRGPIDRALERAGLEVRPGEYVSSVAAIAFLLGVGATLLGSWIVGAILAGLTIFLGVAFVDVKANRRSAAFLASLDTALVTMAGALRAGYGLPQALDTVAREADGPISEEFTRVGMEVRLGRDVVESLEAVDQRVGRGEGSDFSWVVKAISIHRELGGDLAEVLDNVSTTIRDRNRLRARVKAISGEGRLSAYILFGLPIGVFLLISLTRPGYFSTLFDTTAGMVTIFLTVTAMAIGGIWMARIVKVKF